MLATSHFVGKPTNLNAFFGDALIIFFIIKCITLYKKVF